MYDSFHEHSCSVRSGQRKRQQPRRQNCGSKGTHADVDVGAKGCVGADVGDDHSDYDDTGFDGGVCDTKSFADLCTNMLRLAVKAAILAQREITTHLLAALQDFILINHAPQRKWCQTVFEFCVGSHGRTPTQGAGLTSPTR